MENFIFTSVYLHPDLNDPKSMRTCFPIVKIFEFQSQDEGQLTLPSNTNPEKTCILLQVIFEISSHSLSKWL